MLMIHWLYWLQLILCMNEVNRNLFSLDIWSWGTLIVITPVLLNVLSSTWTVLGHHFPHISSRFVSCMVHIAAGDSMNRMDTIQNITTNAYTLLTKQHLFLMHLPNIQQRVADILWYIILYLHYLKYHLLI